MKYFLWRLLGQRFWLKLRSHYRTHGVKFYCEYEMKNKETRNCNLYRETSSIEDSIGMSTIR